jgi:hypothetical protein
MYTAEYKGLREHCKVVKCKGVARKSDIFNNVMFGIKERIKTYTIVILRWPHFQTPLQSILLHMCMNKEQG